jgi:hypothetical protein
VPGFGEQRVDLRAELRVDREPFLARGAPEEVVVQPIDATQLDERVGVIVDPGSTSLSERPA